MVYANIFLKGGQVDRQQADGMLDSKEERVGVLCSIHDGGRYWTIDRTRTFELAFSL